MSVGDNDPIFLLSLTTRIQYDIAVEKNKSDAFSYFCFFLSGVESTASLHFLIGVWVDIRYEWFCQTHQQFVLFEVVLVFYFFQFGSDVLFLQDLIDLFLLPVHYFLINFSLLYAIDQTWVIVLLTPHGLLHWSADIKHYQ